jgi:hypothetical protein
MLGEKITDKGWNGISLLIMVWDFSWITSSFYSRVQQELPIIMVVRCCWLLKLSFGY